MEKDKLIQKLSRKIHTEINAQVLRNAIKWLYSEYGSEKAERVLSKGKRKGLVVS